MKTTKNTYRKCILQIGGRTSEDIVLRLHAFLQMNISDFNMSI
jgi:hypothetical protein